MALNKQDTFDFIVVGGGAAGCAAAAKLSENGKFTVALLEQGRKDVNPWIHIPATFFKALQSEDATAIVSEPDPSLNMKPFVVPQGKVLGGGSSVNGMLYMRGQAQDYQNWVEKYGCEGWSYEEVLQIYKQQEANVRLGGEYHGQHGALEIGDQQYKHPVNKACIEASIAAGIPATDDFNGASQEGVGWYQTTANKGRRKSAAVAFLKPALKRDHLTLFTQERVNRLMLKQRQVTGVEVAAQSGEVKVIKCRKEVILCAGAFHSPKLLMLSGIGPKHHLQSMGIECIYDAPDVGANYQDHVGAPVTYHLRSPIGLYGADRGLKAMQHGLKYLLQRQGLLASNLLEAGACVDTDGDGRADVQLNFSAFAPGAPGQPPLGCHSMHIHPMTMRPESRGRLYLASNDPADDPKLEAAALSSLADLDTLRRGVRLAQRIARQSPLKELIADEIWPGKDINTDTDNAQFDDAIRNQARTIFHPAGTCRMGGDAYSVVDPQLKVRGIEALRVADCSIMPTLVSGNTNAPASMIGGRVADFILQE